MASKDTFVYPPLGQWIREENTCVIRLLGYTDCEGPNEAHHEPPRSQGGQDDDQICLCRKHHRFRHDNPVEFFIILTLEMIAVLKRSYMRGFLNFLRGNEEYVKPKMKVPRKKQSAPQPKQEGHRAPLQHSSKKRSTSKLSKLNVPNYMEQALQQQ